MSTVDSVLRKFDKLLEHTIRVHPINKMTAGFWLSVTHTLIAQLKVIQQKALGQVNNKY